MAKNNEMIDLLTELKIGQEIANKALASQEDYMRTIAESVAEVDQKVTKLSSDVQLQQKDIQNIYTRLDKVDMQRETQLQHNEVMKDDIQVLERRVDKLEPLNKLIETVFTKLDKLTSDLIDVKDGIEKKLTKAQENSKVLDNIVYIFNWFMNKAFLPLLFLSYVLYDKVFA